ncbi:hypothetical protein [Bradyrhizobium sp. BRP23]|uniref:hypothetical protein n=1 Tax=Bradyrhizobium sp. BRP23 TaxID=2793820 RepID=UPI001CD7FBFB|nr:hypothetical protein [Bradyrhizobium sp. BRP23]MCA1419446.1 hypothetical protein [Bradyrhizobium sp. BRP23]
MRDRVEIIDVTEIIPISPLTPRALCRAIVADVATEYGVDPTLITRGNRAEHVVEARTEVARRLHALGMSEQRVADVMHIQIKTARSYLGTLHRRSGPAPYRANHKQETSDANG